MNKKVVLITGATSGIGKSCAFKFASNNYDVVINYLNSDDEAREIKKELEDKYNTNVLLYKANISNEDEVKSMIDEVINKYGRLDSLINNAGIAKDCPLFEKTKDSFNEILNVNLIGTFLTCKYAYKYLKGGSIINVASTNGIDTNYPESACYDASKAGVISLTKNLAIELSPDTRVNAVAPGWTNTRMTKDLDDNYKKSEENKILLKRFANPEEIANVIYFLSSDEASYINGEIIRVDGGYYED